MAIDTPLVVYVSAPIDPLEDDRTIDVVDDNLTDEVIKDTDVAVDEPGTDQTRGLPIDRGWAWMVLAAATFYLMLFGGIKKNFGILFIEFQSRFGSNATLTSLLPTMQNVLLSVGSLLVTTVGMQFMSSRTSIILGSLVLTTAHIITAFSTDIRILFVSVGMLEGTGIALTYPSVTATLGAYFNKRRGFANGIAFSGSSCGALIFAPIVSTLFENYGYTGTLLIVAGMTLNMCVSGVLLRPIHSFEINASKTGSALLPRHRSLSETPAPKEPAHKATICEKLKSSLDFSLFKNPVFPIFLCMAAMYAPSTTLLPAFLAPHGKDINLTIEQRGFLLSVIGGTGVVARVMCALFADRKIVKLTTLLAFMSALVGLTAHMLRLFTGFGGLMAVAVIIGLTCDIYQAMYPVILVEYLTLPRLKSCIGFTLVCHGFVVAGTYPLVGLLRDATGDYLASYHLLGTMQLIGGCIALSLPYVHKRVQSKENNVVSNNE